MVTPSTKQSLVLKFCPIDPCPPCNLLNLFTATTWVIEVHWLLVLLCCKPWRSWFWSMGRSVACSSEHLIWWVHKTFLRSKTLKSDWCCMWPIPLLITRRRMSIGLRTPCWTKRVEILKIGGYILRKMRLWECCGKWGRRGALARTAWVLVLRGWVKHTHEISLRRIHFVCLWLENMELCFDSFAMGLFL